MAQNSLLLVLTITLLSALTDANIVQFLGICVPPDNTKLYLVTVRATLNLHSI